MFRTSALAILPAALLAACSIFQPLVTPSRLLAPPGAVIRVAENVFSRLDIPVESVSDGHGVLRSGVFTVETSWGGEAVEDRVDCGEDDDGRARARLGPIALSITLTAERTVEEGKASAQDQLHRVRSKVRLRSHGTLETPDGERYACRLGTDFLHRIHRAVADGVRGLDDGLGVRPPIIPVRTSSSAPRLGPFATPIFGRSSVYHPLS